MIMDTMIHQGVKLLVGHDGCDPNGTHEEMELLEEWGLPPLEIIKGAGTYAAQWLGCGNLYGTIDEGKTADIVVVNENPLSKITNLKSVFGVLNQTTWIQVEAV